MAGPSLDAQGRQVATRPALHKRNRSRDEALLDKQARMTVNGVAFVLLSAAHLLAAFYSPIQDCDEVFNFWEPAHYLNYGSGLQTWELSPEYSIRSWFYVTLHALPLQMAKLLNKPTSKVASFYVLRSLLALACAFCEARLFAVLSRCLSPRIATFYLLVSMTGTGMFHAATSFLSSTFAMYSFTLALGSFLDWQGGKKTADGLMWLGVGTILGWPFVAILCVPFLAEEAIFTLFDGGVGQWFIRMADGFFRSVAVLAAETVIDSAFIRKLTSAPFNIVLYNVFSGSAQGPDIFGTEPWHFYFRNLALNFNLWFLLALISGPVVILHHFTSARSAERTSLLRKRTLAFTFPLYLWLAIFTLQPHKEERFMYPIYPGLAVNAAIAFHILLVWLGHLPLIPTSLKLAGTMGILLLATVAGVLRSAQLATAYGAPLSIYEPLRELGAIDLPRNQTSNVCIGKEWYRFPSSYHLPASARLRFVRSEFRGLLPGPFAEPLKQKYENNVEALLDLPNRRPGTHLIPQGMNNVNAEDLSKYTDLSECNWLVDSKLPSWQPTPTELDWISEAKKGSGEWAIAKCEPFLDQAVTGPLRRLIWLPSMFGKENPLTRAVWGEYCLLRRVR